MSPDLFARYSDRIMKVVKELTGVHIADDCSSCVTSNPVFYILLSAFLRRALLFRVLTRADCTVSPTNSTGGQIALTRGCDACKWPLTRHKRQATSRTVGRNSRALWQPSWNKIVTTRLEWVILVYTRITHSRPCCNYLLFCKKFSEVTSSLHVNRIWPHCKLLFVAERLVEWRFISVNCLMYDSDVAVIYKTVQRYTIDHCSSPCDIYFVFQTELKSKYTVCYFQINL